MIVRRLGQLANWTEAIDYAKRIHNEVPMVHTLATLSVTELAGGGWIAAPIEMYAQLWDETSRIMANMYEGAETIYAFEGVMDMASEGKNLYSVVLVLTYVRPGEVLPPLAEDNHKISFVIKPGKPERKHYKHYIEHVKQFNFEVFPGTTFGAIREELAMVIMQEAKPDELVEFALTFDRHLQNHGITGFQPDTHLEVTRTEIAHAVREPWPLVS